jgi:thioesterase domain-containing protein/acyl carrier protein
VREVLPDYMTPAAFVSLASLPLTANGKVDRKALPAPERMAAGEAAPGPAAAPRDEVERELVRIWEDLLPGREIGIDQDFFAAGGHSLLAVRLMARIESRFGRTLPLATLLRETTVARLGELLREGAGPAASPLVPIQVPSSGRPGLFCVHPIGGGVLCYRELARHLAPDQPVFGLQAPDLGRGGGGEEESIPTMAATYLEAVRQVQPRGPYLLAGWSFGGVVAFEMAVQLRRRGEPAVVILFDTWAPRVARKLAAVDEPTLLTELVRDHASQAGREIQLDPEPLRRMSPESQLEAILALVQDAGLAPPDLGVSWLRAFLRGYKRRARALQTYEPAVHDGRVILLRASEIRSEAAGHLAERGIDPAEPTHGWGELAAEPVEAHPVPGSHETLLAPPHVEVVAVRLQSVIDDLGEPPARMAGAARDPLHAGDVTP